MGPPDDLYRTPIYGQLYPPLGYAPDGTPQFVPGQQPTRPQPDPSAGYSPDSDTDDPGSAEPPPDDRRPRLPKSDRRLVGILALVAVAALGLLALTVGRAALRSDVEPAAGPTLPVVISDVPTRMPTGVPRDERPTPGAPMVPSGKEVVYEVTATSPTTILYVDDNGLRTTVGAPTNWTITFTSTSNPLRILVLAGEGDARCSISVDGRTVSSDRISAQTPRRTVSCRA